MRNPIRPQPAPPAFGQGEVVPETRASPLARLLFSWLDPFLSVGFSRPLEKEDFWSLPDSCLTHSLTERVEEAFWIRCPPESRPGVFSQDGGKPPNARATEPVKKEATRSSSKETKTRGAEEKEHAETTVGVNPDEPPTGLSDEKRKGDEPKYDSSLLKALHTVFWAQFWLAGSLKFVADTLTTTTPLVNQVLLSWLTKSYVYFRASDGERATLGLQKPPGIGYGIGLAFTIFVMQQVSSLATNHYSMMAMSNGLWLRTSLVGAIFRKSLRLSGRARLEHNVGQITTMISADTVRLEQNAFLVHNLWIAPLQIALGIGLLIRNLGVAALVGLAILLLGGPIEFILAQVMFKQRLKGVTLTDQRVHMTSEVLSGIRLIKYFAWESFYAHQVSNLRDREVRTIRRLAAARALLIGVVMVIPTVATVLSIITYALKKHSLDIAIIFSSVQYFSIIRVPLILLPVVLASATDALVAIRRIGAFMRAEELLTLYEIDVGADSAIDVDADFTWEAVRKDENAINLAATFGDDKKAKHMAVAKKGRKTGDGDASLLPTAATTLAGASPARSEENAAAGGGSGKVKEEDKPFALDGVKLNIPRGAFVAIVGRVGSGKSSLLQALIGEMRKTRGQCTFSSPSAYVPQTAWIMNATLRENIIFGQPEDEARFREVVKACCLEPDLEMFPNGEHTEIGEKGINLSGGQKARVSLARAAYFGADIVLMDDSLSAVDSHVGKKLLDNCLLRGPLVDKTRVLVTHALHVLDKADYIYVMDEGIIVEQGTYTELMADGRMFARLVEEYGSQEENKKEEVVDAKEEKTTALPADVEKDIQKLMQDEERLTGAVTWSVYSRYIGFAGHWMILPLILFAVLSEGAQVANTLFLGFWTSSSIPGFTQKEYMGTYAALGVASGLFAFALSLSMSIMGLNAGLKMFKKAFLAVISSPVAFFDTTPIGRIISRLSKDQDTIDDLLALYANQVLISVSSVLGTVGLVFYTFPYLGIIFAPMIVLYYLAAIYYRRTSVETKRLDSNLRSVLYASYTETLTGLSTVRAYRSQDRFVRNADQGQDVENRAYYMTVGIQRWLGVRLDILGNMLILGICLFAAGFRDTVDPSKIGVVLTYTLSITQLFSTLVSNYAENEQNFNAVERILHYTELPGEGNGTTSTDPPPAWPVSGAIEFKDVEMSYRPGLPAVLKGVSFQINPGEKIGIVGRTGAGKSSLLQALFRIVNLDSGAIAIDGKNIAEMGLETLRGRLALVPQDSLLFKGTVRENLDPLNTRTDAEILHSLKRAWLLPKDGPPDGVAESKFSLDSQVSDEGSNYSAGEKQLLALCRALVKNSRIIVLDEATSSVDVETNAKIQRTIQTEFTSSTLLCIAHRLNTIVHYDRILVMDAGKVAEFDTPLNLFEKEDSVFRSLCNEANLSKQDILKIRATVQGQPSVPASTSASVVHQSAD